MNVKEAIQIAKREMGLEEIPDIQSEQRPEFARRVYEICQGTRTEPKTAKLEEFELWKEKQGKH